MARSPHMEGYFSFEKGLITESHVLSKTEGALSELNNFDIVPRLGLRRRPGAELESTLSVRIPYVFPVDSIRLTGVSVEDVELKEDGVLEKTMLISTNVGAAWFSVEESGEYYYNPRNFISSRRALDNLSPTANANTVAAIAGNHANNMTKGRLVSPLTGSVVGVAGALACYKAKDEAFAKYAPIKYRDYSVWYDGGPSDRPSGRDPYHQYDLRNQGWTSSQISSFYNRWGNYPSLSMSPVDGITTDNQGNEVWKASEYKQDIMPPTTSLTSRGNILLSTDGTVSQTVQINPSEIVTFNCSATYGGRVWYAGNSDTVFYSKLIPHGRLSLSNISSCLSNNSPTDRYDNDPLPTDGGTLSIAGGTGFFHIANFLDQLLLFGSSGVWQISGSEGGSLADPADISVRKISNIGPINSTSIIQASNSIFFFSKGGVYAIAPSAETGALYLQNISLETFHSYFRSIPENVLQTAVGSYDEATERIVWALVDDDEVILININVASGAMYPYTLSIPEGVNPVSVIPFPDKSYDVKMVREPVVVGNDEVYAGLDPVLYPEGFDEVIVDLKNPFNYFFVEFRTEDSDAIIDLTHFRLSSNRLVDWGSVEYKSVAESSYDTWNNPAAHKEIDTLFAWFSMEVFESDVGGGGDDYLGRYKKLEIPYIQVFSGNVYNSEAFSRDRSQTLRGLSSYRDLGEIVVFQADLDRMDEWGVEE